MATVGEALFARGFQQTVWLDQETGARKSGVFNPSSEEPSQRYGSPGLKVKGWLPENYTGAHSTGLNSEAVRLAPLVLGASASPLLDATDLNFIDGATRLVLSLAKSQGLLEESGQGPGPQGESRDRDNAAVLKQALDELDRLVAAERTSVPAAGGGRWANALRNLVASLEEVSRTARAKLK